MLKYQQFNILNAMMGTKPVICENPLNAGIRELLVAEKQRTVLQKRTHP
jgi:hypothetical protein